jgi:Exopolysaccharide synthesis, ExoD
MRSTPTSDVLDVLVRRAPPGEVTLGWLVDNLRTRSFGIVLLLLGIVGLLPAVSPVAGLLPAIPAYQMIGARSGSVFTRNVALRSPVLRQSDEHGQTRDAHASLLGTVC